jgi:hypothetical protein
MSINPHYEHEKSKIDSFINKLDLQQLKQLIKRIEERIAHLNNTTPEQEEIKRLFHPRGPWPPKEL